VDIVLTTGAFIFVLGIIVAAWGTKAMKDPNQPLNRDGGLRIFWGRVASVCGVGVCLIGALLQLA
jgi:hypothetical protein